MSTVAVIGLVILVWGLFAILLALFVGRMIQLRDRQRPTEAPVEDDRSRSSSPQAQARSERAE